MIVDHVQGQRYWGLMLEGSKHGAGVMPDVSVGMEPRAMPKVAVANTSECVAEWSRFDGGARPRVGGGCKAKGSEAEQGFV